MQTMKHSEGLWQASDGAILSHTINDYGNFIICSCDRERTEQDEGNLRLAAAAPWYRILALIAASGTLTAEIASVNSSKGCPGWCLMVDDKSWQWPGGVDGFGVPVPPPEKMFLEIKQAVESL